MIPSDVWQAHVDHKRVHPFHFVLAIAATATHPPRGTAGQNARVFAAARGRFSGSGHKSLGYPRRQTYDSRQRVLRK